MESFTEFDILASNCLKRLKYISNNYGEDQTRVIKCFLSMLFFREYIWKNEHFEHMKDDDEFLDFLEHPKSSRSLSQNINFYSEVIRRIQDALRNYCLIRHSDDFIKNGNVIQEVISSVKDVADINNNKALYDFFFNHLFGEKIDDFVSSLINIFSGKNLKHDFVQEIPLLTGEVAIKGEKSLSLQEQGGIDLYLGMRLYLHGVNINSNSSSGQEVYFIRNVDNAYFKQRKYYPSEKANAFEYLLNLSREQKFHAFVLGSARNYGSSLIELAHSGILRAVIEIPRAYNGHAKNLYVLDSYGENLADVLFINSDKLYSLLRGDNLLLASFISELFLMESDRHSVNRMVYNNDVNNYIKRFFPDGYRNIPGLVYRSSVDEIYANKSMNVSRFVSSSKDEDLIFSPLDYAMIYHDIKADDTVGGHYVIGNNGVGKSLLLRFLAEKLVNENQRLLLVSFGLTDRFHLLKGKRGIVYLGDKHSEKHISLIKRNKEILKCIKNIFSNDATHLFFNSLLKKIGFSENIYCVPAGYTTSNNDLFDYSNVYKMEGFITREEKDENYLLAIRHTNNDQIVIFDNLSSGEQQMLLMFSRIISNIAHGDVMLIDEPEVSMHIEWQQKLPHLFDMISEEYHAAFVVATHSPIIINSVDMNKNKCYTASQSGLDIIDKDSVRNVETTIFDSFDVVTKNNRSVYETCAKSVSLFMEKVNSNQGVKIQYQQSKKELRELLRKLNENNRHALTNEISLVRRAQDAVKELYQSYQQNEQVGGINDDSV